MDFSCWREGCSLRGQTRPRAGKRCQCQRGIRSCICALILCHFRSSSRFGGLAESGVELRCVACCQQVEIALASMGCTSTWRNGAWFRGGGFWCRVRPQEENKTWANRAQGAFVCTGTVFVAGPGTFGQEIVAALTMVPLIGIVIVLFIVDIIGIIVLFLAGGLRLSATTTT